MLLATVGFIAGFVDTLAGGGGLITIPAFLFAGLSPGQALATNKCQAFAGTLTASVKLMASGHLKVRSLWPYATLAFGMALLGAWTLREVSEADWLERAVPLLLLLAACSWIFWLCSPPSGLHKGNSSVRNPCGCWDRDHRFLRWVFWTRNRLVVCAVNDFRVGAVAP